MHVLFVLMGIVFIARNVSTEVELADMNLLSELAIFNDTRQILKTAQA